MDRDFARVYAESGYAPVCDYIARYGVQARREPVTLRIIKGFIIAMIWSACLFWAVKACAHDSWINDGHYRSPAGELCCGPGDCALMAPGSVALTSRGYLVKGTGVIFGAGEAGNVTVRIDEMVPLNEAQPSPDGAYWRCQRPDKTRRCFFAPSPGS